MPSKSKEHAHTHIYTYIQLLVQCRQSENFLIAFLPTVAADYWHWESDSFRWKLQRKILCALRNKKLALGRNQEAEDADEGRGSERGGGTWWAAEKGNLYSEGM